MLPYWSKINDESIKNIILCDEIFTGSVVVIGLGALILNGLSYHAVEYNLTVLSSCIEMDGIHSGLFRYEYIEDYNKFIGYEENSHIPTPERAICNCILYTRWYSFLGEALQFYIEDDELYNEGKLIETAEKLGIPRERILDEIEEVRRYVWGEY